MREIKFRVWQKSLKRFMSQYYDSGERIVMSLEGKPLEWDEMKNLREMSDDFVVQQYTGLKDKNGKDIYEGDILEIEFQNIDNVIHMIKAEVVYDNNGFYENWDGFDVATVKTHQGLRPLTGSTTHEYKGKKFTMGSSGIIGNIFEGVDK